MGYEDGNIIGSLNQNGVCASFKNEDHCGEDDDPIHLTGVSCRGDEERLMECAGD